MNNESEIFSSELSPRELETLELVSKGYSNKQIGDKLCIEYSTVKSHIARLYSKFNFGPAKKTSESSVLRLNMALKYLEAEGYLDLTRGKND